MNEFERFSQNLFKFKVCLKINHLIMWLKVIAVCKLLSVEKYLNLKIFLYSFGWMTVEKERHRKRHGTFKNKRVTFKGGTINANKLWVDASI